MRWRIAGCLPLVMLLACSGPSVPEEQGGGAILTEARPEAVRTRGWLSFPDLVLHGSSESEPPKEPFIRGVIVGGRFFPEGALEGGVTEPPPKRILAKGYLHLETRSFTPDDRPERRREPWLEGWRDTETGAFFPTGQVVGASPLLPGP